ncbi:CPCC family cysteine-rich protein [uncultured Ruminococcus sp.]|jgi:hypothetical protein|uniref:CPCC family cysteine-rich protein n=1 Tax=uncultured Ruminococcus sp. TaxID=165186 RepID=UPI00349F5F6D
MPLLRKAYCFRVRYLRCVCNWENDPVQLANPKLKSGANEMSLQEAIEAFKNGKEVK